MSALVSVEGLHKSYRQGFWMRRVEAVSGISFTVEAGHIFGFLGPNGAGKTTTIKVLTGLIRPTSGDARLFGIPVRDPRARTRVGFLPENPYVYPYLSPREFVQLCAQLSGLKASIARQQTNQVLERVGIAYAADRAARKLSKGMLQRTGLAAALVADPELLILDEPMSGLDPTGRKEVRDLILEERARGRTVLFSTHILSDVEAMCDEVAILKRGKVVVQGKLSELLGRDATASTEVVLLRASEALENYCKQNDLLVQRNAERVAVIVSQATHLDTLLRIALDTGAQIVEVTPRHESLEKLFVQSAVTSGEASGQ
ncbi:MAG TPA: ABC transporter ATP-binding protein [Polyangiaceae bacterium]|jgi:ABC-2 type transport system ATP-binding protein|nr:ABC transporter ATP-binding protein [Polyangiaceae bacterium]